MGIRLASHKLQTLQGYKHTDWLIFERALHCDSERSTKAFWQQRVGTLNLRSLEYRHRWFKREHCLWKLYCTKQASLVLVWSLVGFW